MELEIRRTRPGAPWTYAMLDARQRQIAAGLGEPGAVGTVLLNEVSPVVTVGRRTPASDLLLDRDEMAARGIELQRVDRGGLATYHGPGQWVLFPVERLERLTGDPRGARKAVEGVLEAMLLICRLYEPLAEVRSGPATGVWSPRGKLGAVGVHFERGILLHGLALNVFRTPGSFAGIRPCGLEPRVDFLLGAPSDEAGLERQFTSIGERLVLAVFDVFFGTRPKLDLAAPQGYTRSLSIPCQ
jgi:lipoate-protein ligase B